MSNCAYHLLYEYWAADLRSLDPEFVPVGARDARRP